MTNLNDNQFGGMAEDKYHEIQIANLRGKDASYTVGDNTITPMRNPNGTLKKLTAYRGGPHQDTAYSVEHHSGDPLFRGAPAVGADDAVARARHNDKVHARREARKNKSD